MSRRTSSGTIEGATGRAERWTDAAAPATGAASTGAAADRPPDARPPDAGRPGDRFEDLYVANLDRLVSQLYFVTGDVEEARDCVQEAFARAWVRWARLQADGVDAVAWVYRVAYRISVSRFRRYLAGRQAVRRLGAPPALPGPSPDAVLFADVLARLPHGQRAVVVLHYYEGLRVEEIARLLDLTPSGVKTRLMRARRALGPLLREGDPSHD